MVAEAKVSGIPDLRAALAGIVPKLRKKALRNALAAGARIVRDAAKRATPVLSAPIRNKAGQVIRKPGTVRNAISVRTSKQARAAGDVGVFVNVRPAKGAKVGTYSPDDPFYWRWLNWGWNPSSKATGGAGYRGKRERRRLNKLRSPKTVSGLRFLEAGASVLDQALEKFKAAIGPQIQRLNGGKAVDL